MVENKSQKPAIQVLMLIFLVVVFASVMYFSFGQPEITGQVTLNEQEFEIMTPFGFSLSMLIIGATAAIFVIFLIIKEGAKE